MLVGLNVKPVLCCKINYWPYNTNTEGLRIRFYRIVSEILRLIVAIFLFQESSKCAKLSQLKDLMSMVSFVHPLKTLIFHVFRSYKK